MRYRSRQSASMNRRGPATPDGRARDRADREAEEPLDERGASVPEGCRRLTTKPQEFALISCFHSPDRFGRPDATRESNAGSHSDESAKAGRTDVSLCACR